MRNSEIRDDAMNNEMDGTKQTETRKKKLKTWMQFYMKIITLV